MKKLLLSLIVATSAATSFADASFFNNVGGVSLLGAETADIYCHYMSGDVKLLEKKTGNRKTINNIKGFEISTMANLLLCPTTYNKNYLNGIVAKLDNNYIPIFYSNINQSATSEMNDLVNGYYSNYINTNLPIFLNSMVSSEDNFNQYKVDYTRTLVQIKLPNKNVVTVHRNGGTSDIYKSTPTSADEAIVPLKLYIMQNSTTFTNNEADLISTFMVRYDNQAGASAMDDILIGFGTAYPLRPRGDLAPSVLVEPQKDKNGNIVLKYTIVKAIKSTIFNDTTDNQKPYLIQFELPITINKSSDVAKMDVSFSKKSPFSSVKLLDSTTKQPLKDDLSKVSFLSSLGNSTAFMFAGEHVTPDTFKGI
jgi:hypothetical protein